MSSRCRGCMKEMPKDKHGYEQVCPECKKSGYQELYDKTVIGRMEQLRFAFKRLGKALKERFLIK